jgi:hypothetical protein
MLGLTIRLANRLKIEHEASNANCGVLEGEMRRRLWWAIVIFDARVCELANHKSVTLAPTWDCQIPLNVNDADLRPEMKEPPTVHGQPTEAINLVVRSELADYVRNTNFHLSFTTPSLKPLARHIHKSHNPADGEYAALDKMVEDKYLRLCDPENPLQYMTIWMTRSHVAKYRLMESYADFPNCVLRTDSQQDKTNVHAVRMLEADTNIMSSPLTKPYRWICNYYFPFPAYIHLIQALKNRPVGEYVDHIWEAMNNNSEVRLATTFKEYSPFVRLFARLITHAWEARESLAEESGEVLTPPKVVLTLKHIMEEMLSKHTSQPTPQRQQHQHMTPPDVTMGMGMDDFTIPMPMEFGGQSMFSQVNGQPSQAGASVSGTGNNFPLPKATADFDMTQLDWATMDWGIGQRPAWWR